MPVGTNLGQSFNQGYGTGTSEFLSTDSTVNVARDIYGQEANWNKLKQSERKQSRDNATKEMNSFDPAKFWQADKNVLMPKYEELRHKANILRSKVDDPFNGYSSDPEVQKFQEEWQQLKGMAAQSLSDKGEFEKYQAKKADKTANTLAEDSVKELDDYFSKPISERWGKPTPGMRVKDPLSNLNGFTTAFVKELGKNEFTEQEIDNIVTDNTKGNVEGINDKLGQFAKQAYDNYTEKDKKAARDIYKTDQNGNVNFVEMGKELFKRRFKSSVKVQDYDLTKHMDELAKRVRDTKLESRNSNGKLFININTGEAGKQTLASAKLLMQDVLASDDNFAREFSATYGNQIKTDDLKDLPEEQATKIALDRAAEFGAKRILDIYKEQSTIEKDPIPSHKTTINNYAAEQGGNMEDFLQRIQYNDNTVSNSAANELLGKNQTLGTEIRSVKIERKDASGKDDPNGQKGLGISYVVGYDQLGKQPVYSYEFIPFTPENESRLASLWQGSPSYGRRKGDTNKGVVRPNTDPIGIKPNSKSSGSGEKKSTDPVEIRK